MHSIFRWYIFIQISRYLLCRNIEQAKRACSLTKQIAAVHQFAECAKRLGPVTGDSHTATRMQAVSEEKIEQFLQKDSSLNCAPARGMSSTD